ncbi:hypothetical protein Tco_0632606, partial [Tanacetum coccineum]
MNVSPIPSTRIDKDHPKDQIIRDLNSAIQTRRMTKISDEHAMVFQVTPKTSHPHVVKRIFRYLKSQPRLGLWYPRDSSFDLESFSDSDYVGASLDKKSTIRGYQFLSKRLISWQYSYEKKLIQVIKIHTDYNVADLLTKAFDVSRSKTGSCKINAARQAKYIKYLDTKIPQSSGPPKKVNDEAVHKELGNRMERAATTASSLGAEQDNVLANCFYKYTEYREVEITATIDGQLKTITEASLRRHLKLEDSGGISSLPNNEIFEQLALMGYTSDSDKLTFQKGHFSPQWRFLINTILYCLSPKKTAWEQFSSNIATAIIYLATNKTFNFSKMIFEGMGEGSTVPVESHHTPITTPSTSQPPLSSPSR